MLQTRGARPLTAAAGRGSWAFPLPEVATSDCRRRVSYYIVIVLRAGGRRGSLRPGRGQRDERLGGRRLRSVHQEQLSRLAPKRSKTQL